MTCDDWERVIDVNLGGVFNCTNAFFDDVQKANHGRLINISSVVGQQGNYGQANYAATKSGLFGFTRTIALEFASTGSTANCVAPGFVKTDMLADVPEEVKEKIRRQIPPDRFAEVEDVAGIVRFVAGKDSAYMTGQIFFVNDETFEFGEDVPSIARTQRAVDRPIKTGTVPPYYGLERRSRLGYAHRR